MNCITYLVSNCACLTSSPSPYKPTHAKPPPPPRQIQLGTEAGRHEFRNLRVLQETLDTAAVRVAAMADRTQRYRKGNFVLRALDAGTRKPAALSRLNVTLARHHFLFGAAVAPEVVREVAGEEGYRRYREIFADNFWSMTPENAFKWPNYEPEEGRVKAGYDLLKAEYTDWARDLG